VSFRVSSWMAFPRHAKDNRVKPENELILYGAGRRLARAEFLS
jgi:hypothetical protein